MKNGKVSSNVPEKSNLSPNLHPASSDWGQPFLYPTCISTPHFSSRELSRTLRILLLRGQRDSIKNANQQWDLRIRTGTLLHVEAEN